MSPTDYGNYYAWGETSPKSVYNWSTYAWASNSNELTKYCTYSSYGLNGFTDGLTILQPGDDAATANYGGRTPTIEEWRELNNNTTSRWVTINEVNGRCFTGPNGNSLFLPAAGYRDGSVLDYAGIGGCYWSSSLNTGNPCFAWYDDFGSVGWNDRTYYHRYCGHSVRAVLQN